MDQRIRLSEELLQSARQRMVDDQLVRRGIKDPVVLAAMGKVPRHEFVLPEDLVRAYADYPLEIGQGQTISQPYVVASMTEELRLRADSKVLEIGTGCGYQTAILAEVAGRVFTIERIRELYDRAIRRLEHLGYANITGRVADGALGWPDQAPFDAILVTAAAIRVPPALLEQLASPGRMIIPVGRYASSQELILIEKNGVEIRRTVLYGVRFVPLQTPETDPPEPDETQL